MYPKDVDGMVNSLSGSALFAQTDWSENLALLTLLFKYR